jgi:molybdopterin-guanine dinucleotide biosynthesis protein A
MSAHDPDQLTGVVLAGGASMRLGRDKALVRLGGDDAAAPDLLARTVALLRDVCGSALVVGRMRPGCDCVADGVPGRGPAGGIATALEAAGGPCLSLSCDLPFMERGVLQRLIAARAKRPEGTLFTAYAAQATGRIEALVAVYEHEALPLFQDRVARGLLKPIWVIPRERQHLVPYAAEQSRFFFNINRPADLEAARAMARAMDKTMPEALDSQAPEVCRADACYAGA